MVLCVHYKFRHSTTWYTIECPGMLRADQFLRYLQEKHKLRRLIMEEPMEFIRPSTRVILRHVHPSWKPTPQPTPQPQKEMHRPAAFDIDAEFGPDPLHK